MTNLFFLVGDLNIISLDYSINANVCHFFNLVFQNRGIDKKIGVLDIYKLNIYHIINLMFS